MSFQTSIETLVSDLPRSSSAPAKRLLKSALHSPGATSPPAQESAYAKQKKSAHFDEAKLVIEAAIRRATTDPQTFPSTMVSGDSRSRSLPQRPIPRYWTGSLEELRSNLLSDYTQYEDDGDEYSHQRHTIEQFWAPTGEGATRTMEYRSDVADDGASESVTLASNDTASLGEESLLEKDHDDDPSPTEGEPLVETDDDDAGNGMDQTVVLLDDDSTQVDSESPDDVDPGYLTQPDSTEFREHEVHDWSSEIQTMPPIAEEGFPSYEEPIPVSAPQSPRWAYQRRASDTNEIVDRRGRRMTKTDEHRRYNSLTEFCRMKGRVARNLSFVAPKAPPAKPAVTAISVRTADAPRLNTVYSHPAERHRPLSLPKEPIRTAQTVHSDLGVYQMMWEDSPPSSSGSGVTVFHEPAVGIDFIRDEISRGSPIIAPSPMMEKVKTKLTAWNWERDLGGETPEERSGWLPLMDTECRRCSSDRTPSHEQPPNPPNTARSSAKASKAQSPAPESPYEEDEEEELEWPPVEIRVKGILATARPHTAQPTRATTPTNDYLSQPRRHNSLPASPSIPRNLSNLAEEEAHFQSHRDSVEITRGHLKRRQTEGRPNSLLFAARDSFTLAKTKLETRSKPYPMETGYLEIPYRRAASQPHISWNRFGGLSPIPDASPPNASKFSLASAASLVKEHSPGPSPGEAAVEAQQGETRGEGTRAELRAEEEVECSRVDEHENCPICKCNQPRWFEANHARWKKM